VDAQFPITQLGSVTLAAQYIRFSEIDEFSTSQVQLIAIIQVMTVKAPAVFFVVF
jgi:hypothetical protein